MLTVNKLTQVIYDVRNVLETPSKLSLWTILEGADWKKLALALEVEAFQQAFFFFFSVLYRSFSFLSPHALARIMLLSSN